MPRRRRDISRPLLHEIKRQLDAAPHGAKDRALEPYAEMLDMSIATIRRHLRETFGAAKRATGRPPSISEDLLHAVWDYIVAGEEMGLQARQVPVRIALAQLAALGFEGAAEASVSGVNAAIRRKGWRRGIRRQRMEPAFALDVVHLDFSRSKYCQIYAYSPAEEDYILRIDGRQLQYKEEGRSVRSWLVSIVDGHSRMARAKMYPATGEDATLALLALREFWDPESEALFSHPPRALWMDRGAAGRTEFFQHALASVGIDLHLAQTKEAQGKVERQFRTLWSAFELPLALELGHGKTLPMREYNARLNAFLAEQATWKHPTMPGTREEAYRESLRRRLPDGTPVERRIDVDLFSLAFSADVRVVDVYGCVTLDRVSYRLPEQVGRVWVEQGMRVRCYRYPDGTLVANLIDEPHEEPFFCQPESAAHAHPVGRRQTPREAARERIDVRQPAHERLGAAEARRAEPEPPTDARLDVARHGTPVYAFRMEPEQLTPQGPREEAARAQSAHLAGAQLRAYVGRRLAPYGLTYASVEHVFAPLEHDPDTLQEHVDQVLTAFIVNRVA